MPEVAELEPPIEFVVLAARFVRGLEESSESERERRSKRTILQRHLVPAFAKVRLDELRAQDIEDYKANKLAQGLSRKTVNNHLAVLRRLLHFARAARVVGQTPEVLTLALEPELPRFLDREQAQRLIENADGEFRAMIVLALRTGLRLGELRALTWADVDPDNGHLRIRTSNPRRSKEREIPLSPKTLRMLADHPRRSEFVFTNPGGAMLTHGACKWPLYRAARRAGLDAIGWQVLRNTFAHELLESGASPRSVQALLGCRSLLPLLRYPPATRDRQRHAILLLDVKDVARTGHTLRWNGSSGRPRPEAARERSSPLFVFVANDRRQSPELSVPALRVSKVAVLPSVTGLESAN
jgi:site-specific recombinase XerD